MVGVTEIAAEASGSALDAALGRVGDRWSFLVVEALLDGPRRFNELATALPGIAPNILTDRLRRLELAGVLRLLAAWGTGSAAAEGLRHVACGSLLEARWYCPTCATTVDENDE